MGDAAAAAEDDVKKESSEDEEDALAEAAVTCTRACGRKGKADLTLLQTQEYHSNETVKHNSQYT